MFGKKGRATRPEESSECLRDGVAEANSGRDSCGLRSKRGGQVFHRMAFLDCKRVIKTNVFLQVGLLCYQIPYLIKLNMKKKTLSLVYCFYSFLTFRVKLLKRALSTADPTTPKLGSLEQQRCYVSISLWIKNSGRDGRGASSAPCPALAGVPCGVPLSRKRGWGCNI